MATWIVSAGDNKGRNYAEYFFRFGMAFVGGETQRAYMKQVVAGDKILLKRGLSEFLAAGIIVLRNGVPSGDVGDNVEENRDHWLHDIDGWDLPGYCYVEWHRPIQPRVASGLKQGTIYQTNQPQHLQAAEELLSGPKVKDPQEPTASKIVGDEEILEFLISEGLRPSAADELTDTVRKIRLLAKYYSNSNWGGIREHEARTFLVVPLLLALGWAEQQMKIELPCSKGRIDIACFSRPYHHDNKECLVLVETKDFGSGLDYAQDQAKQYASDFPQAQVLLVTNGYCYKMFRRSADGLFSEEEDAYLNLIQPRDKHPLNPERGGAKEVMKWLLPTSLR